MGRAQNSAGLGMFGSPRSPAAPWYGYSHDLDADEPSPRASRSHTHSPAGDPTLELEIATSFNTVLNKMRRLEADLGRPLRSPKHSPGKSQSPTSDARMKRMEKMERRLTWVLENGAAQPVRGAQAAAGGGASESERPDPPAGDEPMPEASRTLARRELERLTTERDEALAALAAERTARERSERADAYARLLAENRRLASENAELRAAMTENARRATGPSTRSASQREDDAHEPRRLGTQGGAEASMIPPGRGGGFGGGGTGGIDQIASPSPSRTTDGVPASPSRGVSGAVDDVQAEPARIVAG